MDDQGRLIIPGKFVGKTFRETGVVEEMRKEAQPEVRGEVNRHARRLAAHRERQAQRLARVGT